METVELVNRIRSLEDLDKKKKKRIWHVMYLSQCDKSLPETGLASLLVIWSFFSLNKLRMLRFVSRMIVGTSLKHRYLTQ